MLHITTGRLFHDLPHVEGREITALDVTRKSGIRIFAPTWEMVMAFKHGKLLKEDFSKQYHQLMRESYRHHANEWETWLYKAEEEKRVLALMCYCPPPPVFCHRHLLKNFMIAVAIRIEIKVDNIPEDWGMSSPEKTLG